jgi:23S rRNA pseudouridine1911/1915/1917 synthase
VTSRTLPVPDGLDGMRVDAGLAKLLGLSRTAVAALTESGDVSLDGRTAGKSDRLTAGAWLEVTIPEPEHVVPPPAEVVPGLRVIHEDDDIIVVDKPVGVAAHPSPGWTGPTVIGGLAAAGVRISTSGAAERQAFKERTVDKGYHALVQGHPDPTEGTIDAPIDRHPKHDYRFAVVANGRPSVTHYKVLEAFRAASLVDIKLETGRTHQIRVHFSALHHPCVGDLAYGADPVLAKRLKVTRQWLHARQLAFDHPADGRRVEFTSDYPDDLRAALDKLIAES